MSFDAYLSAQERNLQALRTVPHFTELVLPVNELYERGVLLVPSESPVLLARMMLLCHKSLLSAAALIVRGLPDDAAAVTRRAAEIARTAMAIKDDPQNRERWIDYEQRLVRWEARNRGERPKGRPGSSIRYPRHPIVDSLGAHLGILSDALVHFTPEFLNSHGWKERATETGAAVFLEYFTTSQQPIETHLCLLAGIHLQILQLFDECFGHAFLRDQMWVRTASGVKTNGERLCPAPNKLEEA